MRDLQGKRILITGSGHGLGLELAKQFGRAGGEIIVSDRDSGRVSDAVALLQRDGLSACGYRMDVTIAADVQAVHDQILATHGPLDVLINNAGVVRGGTFENISLQDHRLIFEVNVLGTMTVTHTFLTEMLARPDAHIVNVASASALLPLPFAATYASSKWAVLGFSESLLEELRLTGHEHVRVTSVCPGYIATGMFSGVKPPRFMPMLTPTALAERIVRAVRSNQELLLTPWQVRLLPLIKALLPRPLQRWLGNRLGVLDSMATWRDLTEPTRLAKEPLPAHAVDVIARSLSK